MLINLLLGAVSLGLIRAVAIDPYAKVDFYKLFNDPEAHLHLQPRLTTADRIAAHGYPVEEHFALTEDGYIIGLYRIPYSHKLQNQNSSRPVVFIQHGLFSCSDGWILIGPDNALPFLLADAGYDVWLGNARGNTYSRNHTTLLPGHPYFWRFSWHEIGHYDIAAMMDYALSKSSSNQGIHYVGHSQGTTALFVLLSTRPEYNAKIKTAHMLAPVAFMANLNDYLVRKLSPYLGHPNLYASLFGSQEFLPHNDFVLAMLYNICRPDSKYTDFCTEIMTDTTTERQNTTALADYASTHPAGVSTDQILHYMQGHQYGYFRQFDFGLKKNLKVYKNHLPPDYPLDKISSEIHLWFGDNDELAAVVDVLHLADLLPNRIKHRMTDPLWDHGDFISNWKVRQYINEPVIAIMQNYEEKKLTNRLG